MDTLLEFANAKRLTLLLVKERAKCLRSNGSDKKKRKRLNRECDIDNLSTRKMLSRIMPPRYTWVRPSKRVKQKDGSMNHRKNAEKAILLTIDHDKNSPKRKKTPQYQKELDDFIDRIKERLSAEQLSFESPQLIPILKSTKQTPKGPMVVTCRPLSVYSKLEDKIIIALTTRYLTRILDRHLHKNILSYRPPRRFYGKEHHVTDFNDGITLIEEFRKNHEHEDIFVSDCDIKKFYDTIPHNVVIECFERILQKTKLNEDGKAQVMRVIKAYLNSYNFYSNAWLNAELHPQVFAKVRRRLRDKQYKNCYKLSLADEIWALSKKERMQRGVPQGGALSQIIANVVLNDVDQVITSKKDDNRLFLRFCDDMILMHTSRNECTQLMKAYTESLKNHGLYYHDFEQVANTKVLTTPNKTSKHFWDIKSHSTFKWGDGEGDSNRYIGFLGYEMQRDGKLRIRKSNIQRIKEKINSMYYALSRYQSNEEKTEEEKIEHTEKAIKYLMNRFNVYTALDQERFRRGWQYRVVIDLKDQLVEKLSQQKALNESQQGK